MEISEWYWKSGTGQEMYARAWAPAGTPKAAIVLVHGTGEHVVRYDHVAAALMDNGYVMLGFDLCGHGKSGGPRGHTRSYEALMDDIRDFIDQVKERFPDLPLFLYGHSLGGNLVLNYALRRRPDLRGVIATGPWLKLAFEPPASKVKLARMMSGIAPAFTQHSKLDASGLSHDLAVIEAYKHDPLVHDKISAQMFVDIYDTGLWALDHAAEFPLPLLLMHGSADPIISAGASREFAEKAGANVTFKLWNGMFHEIHNELGKTEVFTFMLAWLDSHLP